MSNNEPTFLNQRVQVDKETSAPLKLDLSCY